VVICLERGANDLIMASRYHNHPIISCFIKIQVVLTFLVAVCPGCPGKETTKCVSVCSGVTQGLIGPKDRISGAVFLQVDPLHAAKPTA